jgi:hypothetical protein
MSKCEDGGGEASDSSGDGSEGDNPDHRVGRLQRSRGWSVERSTTMQQIKVSKSEV